MATPDTMAPPPAGWRRILLPSLSDVVFLFFIVWPFVLNGPGWSVLLRDGDTGWHIRVGDSILRSGSVPRTDPFSFSKPGEPWFAWEWLSEVLMSLVHSSYGLKGLVLVSGVMIALTGVLLLRFSIWRGANTLIALAVTLLCFGASSVHYLARPHLFTLVFLLASLWIVERDRRRRSRTVWLLVPLTVLWTNLHGGFPVLLAALGLLSVGSLIESFSDRERREDALCQAGRYALLGALCLAGTTLNPYGLALHRHIIQYLQSDWIRTAVEEFRSPSFRSENMLQYEVLLLAGLATAGWLIARKRVVEALWILAWAHFSLSAVRHIPVYLIFAGPLVAAELSRWWHLWIKEASPRSVRGILKDFSGDLAPGFRRSTAWPVALVGLMLFVDLPLRWPDDFPDSEFPVAMIEAHETRINGARVFTHDQWADYLIYRYYPKVRVFMDGRTDFYGPEVGQEYIALMGGLPEWRELLAKYQFDLALIPPEVPLAALLAESPEWQLADRREDAVMYVRKQR